MFQKFRQKANGYLVYVDGELWNQGLIGRETCDALKAKLKQENPNAEVKAFSVHGVILSELRADR